MTGLYIFFLGIVPFVALIALFMYYTRRNITYWWKKSSSSHSATNTQSTPYVNKTSSCFSFSGCLGRLRALGSMHVGGGRTVTSTGKPKDVSPSSCRVKPNITKTALISTTNVNVDVITVDVVSHTSEKVRIPSPNFTKSSEHKMDKGVILSVKNIKELPPLPSGSGNVSVSQRKETFMQTVGYPQTQLPAKASEDRKGASSKTKKPGNRNTSTSSTGSSRSRKNSKSLMLKVKQDPIKQKLVESTDSSPSTPETPPIVKFQRNLMEDASSRPSVAKLSSKFERLNLPDA